MITKTQFQQRYSEGTRVRVTPAGAFAISFDGRANNAQRIVGQPGLVTANDGMFVTVELYKLDLELLFKEREIELLDVCPNCKLDPCDCPSFDLEGSEV